MTGKHELGGFKIPGSINWPVYEPDGGSVLEFEIVRRKQNPMKAVQVGVGNAEEIAEWCGGEVVDSTVRLAGASTSLPAVKLKRESRGGKDYTTALVTYWVVQFPSEFRIFRDGEYSKLFEKELVVGKPKWMVGKRVLVTDVHHKFYGHEGEIYSMNDAGIFVKFGRNQNGGFEVSQLAPVTDLKVELSGEGAPLTDSEMLESRRVVDALRMHSVGPAKEGLGQIIEPMENQDEGKHALNEDRKIAALCKNGALVRVITNGDAAVDSVYAGQRGVVKWREGEIQPPICVVIDGVGERNFEPNELEIFDPFAEPPNPTPAGESLKFREGEKVQVITTTSPWFQYEGVVKYSECPHGIVGVAFMDDVVSAREFTPIDLRHV